MNAASMQISLNETGPSLPEPPGLLMTLINLSRRKEDAGKYSQLLLVPVQPPLGAAAEALQPGWEAMGGAVGLPHHALSLGPAAAPAAQGEAAPGGPLLCKSLGLL